MQVEFLLQVIDNGSCGLVLSYLSWAKCVACGVYKECRPCECSRMCCAMCSVTELSVTCALCCPLQYYDFVRLCRWCNQKACRTICAYVPYSSSTPWICPATNRLVCQCEHCGEVHRSRPFHYGTILSINNGRVLFDNDNDRCNQLYSIPMFDWYEYMVQLRKLKDRSMVEEHNLEKLEAYRLSLLHTRNDGYSGVLDDGGTGVILISR